MITVKLIDEFNWYKCQYCGEKIKYQPGAKVLRVKSYSMGKAVTANICPSCISKINKELNEKEN